MNSESLVAGRWSRGGLAWRGGALVSLVLLGPVLLGGVGCSDSAAHAPAVRDSAGVRIVENIGPAWSEATAWRLTDEPLVSIGGADGDPLYDFNSANAARLSDGRIVVANGDTWELRFYDAEGRHLSSSGRRGGGPGEFQMLGPIFLGAGDSLLVPDLMQQRLSVLAPDGSYTRGFSLGGASGFPSGAGGSVSLALPTSWLGDGAVLGVSQSFRMNDAREGRYRDSIMFVVYHPDGSVRDSLGKVPGMEMEQMTLTFGTQSMGVPAAVPLGRQTVAAGIGERIYVATNDAWQIEERATDGRLVRLIRIRSEPVRITEADIAAHRVELEEQMSASPQVRMAPAQLMDQMRAHIGSAAYPPTLPFIVRILADETGTVWVQEVIRPGIERQQFALLDSTGAFLGRLTMPERFVPQHVSHDAVTGVWKDADDVEYVRVYGIRR